MCVCFSRKVVVLQKTEEEAFGFEIQVSRTPSVLVPNTTGTWAVLNAAGAAWIP